MIDALQIAYILQLDIACAIIINRGILTDIYDAPSDGPFSKPGGPGCLGGVFLRATKSAGSASVDPSQI